MQRFGVPPRAVLELCVGGFLVLVACMMLTALPPSARSLDPETSASTLEAYAPTLRTTAPPSKLGPRYDRDDSMAKAADPVASYSWVAHLDPLRHRITARGTITFVNRTPVPARRLYFHLYLNAFKNDRSLFLRSPFGAGRSGDKAEHYGFIDVKRMVALEFDRSDLWKNASKHSPGDPEDETDIFVPLPKPVQPGGQLHLEVEFEAQLPQIVERTGYADSYHFVGQWFPKLAKHEPDGSWAHFPFHPQSEFYADFGDYHVTLEVPTRFVVGATGKRVSLKEHDGQKTLVYEQKNVTDFAWVAWDGFATREKTMAGVAVRLLYPEGDDGAAATTMATVEDAIEHFNRHYGRYPYDTLTVVHPPVTASNSGGMEYPTLITTGSRWYTSCLGIRDLELVTIHELAHQWFYGLVATDEHTWPFMDEGITSYAEEWAAESLYGNGSLMDNELGQLSVLSFTRALAAAWGRDDIVGKPAKEFTSFNSLGALVYQRTATILDTLARVYGRKQLDQALGRYARYYRFKHPAPPHLVAVLREVLGDGAAANFEAAVFERGNVDYVARALDSVREREPAGIFEKSSGRTSIEASTPAVPPVWLSRAVVTRRGSLKFPVDIELAFEDGTTTRQRWSGEGTTRTLEHRGASRLVSVQVDPDHTVTLDDNLLNNALSDPKADLALLRHFARFLAQLTLAALGP